jgi:hypothetical protein
MRLHEILARCVDIIRTYDIVQYEVVGLHSRLKLKIVFANGTELHVRDILLDGQQRKYAFHWQDGSGRLIARWDNAAHWPQIATSPHHKHVGDPECVVASEATTLEEVLAVIRENM